MCFENLLDINIKRNTLYQQINIFLYNDLYHIIRYGLLFKKQLSYKIKLNKQMINKK